MNRFEDGYTLLKAAAAGGDRLGLRAVDQVERGMAMVVRPAPGTIDEMLFESSAVIMRT